MSIKYIFFDLDKTLLTDDGLLPENFENSLETLKRRGITIAACSARPITGIMEVFGEYFHKICGICDNGNSYFYEDHYETLFSFTIEEIKELEELVKNDSNIALLTSNRNGYYVDDISMERFRKLKVDGLISSYRPLNDYYNNDEKLSNIHIWCIPPNTYEDILSTSLKPYVGKYKILEAGFNWFSLLHPEGGKATGLKALLGELNITPDEALSFGDSENDVPMFELIPNSYAMLNAPDYIKEKAFGVTKLDNNHGGAMELALELTKNQEP